GEGNGGVIEPQVGYVRDSLVSMAYVLAGLTAKKTTVADWADSLPYYTIVKDKLVCPATAVETACDALRTAFPDAEARDGDGLRLDWKDRWVQVRASNTEPIIRVIAEAPEQDDAVSLIDRAMAVVEQAVKPFVG
ncbi:MAG: phosphoglucosamine mutase, partial [Planctomycetaceae bacterium]|nr:phosphoglucosamine mutase [Planctomycetaceae bacterium]